MKLKLAEHKETLEKLDDYLKKEAEFVMGVKARYVEQERAYQFYLQQYEAALRAKKLSFDRSKYLIKSKG